MSQESSVSQGAVFYLGSKLFTKCISFLLIPLWTLVFTPAEYGVIGNLAAWAGFLSPLVMMGLPNAALRIRSDCHDERQWARFVSSVALVLTVASCFFLLVSCSVGSWIWGCVTSGSIPFWPLVPITLVAVALGALSRLALVVHQAEQKPLKVIAYEQALSTVVIVCTLIAVFLFDGGVIGYVSGGLVGVALVSVFFAITLWQRRSEFSFECTMVVNALKYGLPLIPQAVAAWTLNLSDRVMLERFSGLSEAGLYNLAANFGIVISMVAISINQAVLPRYLQRAKGEFVDENARSKTLHDTVIQGFVVLVVIFILTATAGPFILGLMVNERFFGALSLLVPILGGCFFFGMGQFLLLPLLHQKRTKIVAAITLTGAVVNVVLNLYLIPQYGAIAAAYTTLASYMLTCLLAYLFARRSSWMGVSAFELLAMCGGAVLSLLVCLIFTDDNFSALAIRFVFNGALVSGFVLWLLKLYREGKALT